MKGIVLSLLFCLIASFAQAFPIIIIVRHAEKAATGGKDPDLSDAGQKRAEALAKILRDASITAVFTTELKRTQETAAPTAREFGITPTVVAANDIEALRTHLLELKGNALVVGHGNTIPNLLKNLGFDKPIDIPDNEYTNLFVLTLGEKPQLLRLHYPL